MLKTTGNSSTPFDSDSAVGFVWSKKQYVATNDTPLVELTSNVKCVTVTFSDENVANEVDDLIASIVRNDAEKERLDADSKKRKARLDEIATLRIRSTRKTNSLMDFLREKWNTAMLPFTTVIAGKKYKATKTRGSEGKQSPDFEQIVSALIVRHPKLTKEVDELKKSLVEIGKSSASRWSNFSEISSEE